MRANHRAGGVTVCLFLFGLHGKVSFLVKGTIRRLYRYALSGVPTIGVVGRLSDVVIVRERAGEGGVAGCGERVRVLTIANDHHNWSLVLTNAVVVGRG